MPTEAFYKLNDSKKEQLINSAIHEFSTLPYEKVSIFKIAQNAEVSRSGFYYYFKDKKDIYSYLISEIKDEFINKYSVSNKKIDIFELGKHIFSFICEIKGTSREALFRNIVRNTRPDDLKTFFSFISDSSKPCELDCSLDGIKFDSQSQLSGIIMFMATGIMYSLSGYLDNEYNIDVAQDKLEYMFDIIKYGVLKGEKGA